MNTHGHAGLKLGVPAVVAVSRPEYAQDPAGRWWGFFQFPDLWRGNDGLLYLAVNVGADSTVGRHEPTLFFRSVDGGKNWESIALDLLDLTPEAIELADGSQAAFGSQRYVCHYHELMEGASSGKPSAKALALRPATGSIRNPYGVTESCHYRYDDIPEADRRFPVAWRPSRSAAWEQSAGILEADGFLVGAMARNRWWDDHGRCEWVEQDHLLEIPIPKDPGTLATLPDGTILWALSGQHPRVLDRLCGRVVCCASADGGRTWRQRGVIAGDTDRATWGYGFGEQALARMPNGDLLCVMRTKSSNAAADTHYLAAARSADGGFTWTMLEPLSEFSVTPHLLALANGTVAVIYGRPGAHVKASADSGLTWGESQPLVGPPEKELLAKPLAEWWAIRHDFSCANTSVVVTGPDRFLAAYSDFRHTNAAGERCKAICVREVRVE